jgi:hypothetical protein
VSENAQKALREAREAVEAVRCGRSSIPSEIRYEGPRAYVVELTETAALSAALKRPETVKP